MGKSKGRLSAHAKSVLAELNNSLQKDKFVDVNLIVEGVHMKAHRVVLAACSDYFTAMFLGSMTESKQFDIVLHDVSAKAMEMLLEYIYTSKLHLDHDNIQEILSTATYIQMSEVILLCSAYLKDHVSFENFTDVASLADMYHLEELKEEIYRFLCNRVHQFSRTPEFHNLTCEHLDYALQSNFPVDCSEETIIEIVSQYCLRHNVTKEWIDKLFAGIQLMQIQNIYLKSMPNFTRLVYSDHAPPVLQKIYNDLKKLEGKKQDFFLGKDVVFNSRGKELALIVLSGGKVTNNQVNLYFPNQNKWFKLTSSNAYCGAAVIGHDIFFYGTGRYMMGSEDVTTSFNHTEKYNVLTNKWTKYAKEPTHRKQFSLTAVAKYLYVVGGKHARFSDGPTYVINCVRYNTVTGVWEYIAPMLEPRHDHSATHYKLFLYISGGICGLYILNTLWCYDIRQDSWHQKKPMLKRRANHVLVTIDDQIYACGGWFFNNNTHVPVPEIEVYDIEADTWRLETIVPEPSYYTGITAFERKIYFVGGRSPEDKTHMWNKMQIYDVVTQEWSTQTMLGSRKWGCYCTTIYVPPPKDE